jgi:hypothetical protein
MSVIQSVLESPRLKQALLSRHKRRQRAGLWCEKNCPFHRQKTAEETWAGHTNGWTWMVHDNIDQLTREGLFDDNRRQILRAAKEIVWD